MRLHRIAILTALAAAAVYGAESGPDANYTAVVCVEQAPGNVVGFAQQIVSSMFAAIHVTIAWRAGLEDCPAGGVKIALSDAAAPNVSAGALAYAKLREGDRVVLRYNPHSSDRDPLHARAIMAHVMAHEVTHILQGVARHSEVGLMKASWDQRDLHRMNTQPLPFTEEDIRLIHDGLARRAVAATTPQANTQLETAAASR